MKRSQTSQAEKARESFVSAQRVRKLLEMHKGIIERILNRSDLTDQTKETMREGYENYIVDLRRPS